MIEQDFIDLRDRQNSCPSVKEIFEFMQKYPSYTAHGYTIAIKRDDYRVSLEGVAKYRSANSMDELRDFIDMFRYG